MSCGNQSDNAQHSCVRPDGHTGPCTCGCRYSWFPDDGLDLPRVTRPLRISERDLQQEPAAIDHVREAAAQLHHLAQDPPT